jgi:hypothetical protein
MTTPHPVGAPAPDKINELRRGQTYLATTRHRTAIGEYLGIETAHGDRAILLRHTSGTESIEVDDLTSIQPAAA